MNKKLVNPETVSEYNLMMLASKIMFGSDCTIKRKKQKKQK